MARAIRQIQSENLREAARRMIRAGIITGEIEAGGLYSARTLAERLGVSATPVREAMLDLASEGLVLPIRNRGFQVVGLSEHDLDEILELRIMLEVPATAEAAKLLSVDEITALGHLSDAMLLDAERRDLQAFLDRDMEFHLRILGSLQNRRLLDLVRRLREQTRLTGLSKLAASGQLTATAAEHSALVEALAAGDRRTVEVLIRRHLEHTRGVWAGKDERAASTTVRTGSSRPQHASKQE